MSKHPNLAPLKPLFDQGTEFQLTDAQYEKKTGVMLPKEKSYLKNKSALAKMCKENGYELFVQEKTVYFRKVK